jgi:hypothetical protein
MTNNQKILQMQFVDVTTMCHPTFDNILVIIGKITASICVQPITEAIIDDHFVKVCTSRTKQWSATGSGVNSQKYLSIDYRLWRSKKTATKQTDL